MNKDKQTYPVRINLTASEKSILESEAIRMGFISKRGKQSPKLATYIREKIFAKQDRVIKIHGVEKLFTEYLLVQSVMKDLNFLVGRIREQNRIKRGMYPDAITEAIMPELDEGLVKEVLKIAKHVDTELGRQADLMLEIGQALQKLEDDHGIMY